MHRRPPRTAAVAPGLHRRHHIAVSPHLQAGERPEVTISRAREHQDGGAWDSAGTVALHPWGWSHERQAKLSLPVSNLGHDALVTQVVADDQAPGPHLVDGAHRLVERTAVGPGSGTPGWRLAICGHGCPGVGGARWGPVSRAGPAGGEAPRAPASRHGGNPTGGLSRWWATAPTSPWHRAIAAAPACPVDLTDLTDLDRFAAGFRHDVFRQLRRGAPVWFQSEVSKLERRSDMFTSTLRKFIEATGGELHLVARTRSVSGAATAAAAHARRS